jgi:hypothetical protein
VANAVEDALADRGVTIDRVPVASAMLFEALRAASHTSHHRAISASSAAPSG